MGLRDQALLSVLVYSFARVSAAVGMRRQDYFRQGTRGWLRPHEKGGKRHDVPGHHRAEEAVEAHLAAVGLEDPKAPLFQRASTGRPAERSAAGAPGRAGHDQATGVGGVRPHGRRQLDAAVYADTHVNFPLRDARRRRGQEAHALFTTLRDGLSRPHFRGWFLLSAGLDQQQRSDRAAGDADHESRHDDQ